MCGCEAGLLCGVVRQGCCVGLSGRVVMWGCEAGLLCGVVRHGCYVWL